MQEKQVIEVKSKKDIKTYLVICKGGATEFYEKNIALNYAKVKETSGLSVRVYEKVSVDQNDFDCLWCIYFSGCNKTIIQI